MSKLKPSEIWKALGIERKTVYRWVEIAETPHDTRYTPLVPEDIERHPVTGRLRISDRVLTAARRFAI